MRKIIGFIIVIFSVFAWFILLALRWDYMIRVLQPAEPMGEAIWAYDPGAFIVISFFCGVLALIGLLLIFSTLERDYYAYRTKRKAS